MSFFTNKKILKRILLVLLLILLFQFVFNNPSHASGDYGGVLLEPISNLFASLGDAIMNILQKGLLGMESAGTWVGEEGLFAKILTIVIGAVLIGLVILSAVLTGGFSVAVFISTGLALLKIAAGTAIAYFTVTAMGIGDDRILCTKLLCNSRQDFF